MKKMVKQLAALVVGIALSLSLAACSSSKDVVYPVTLDGTEIIVGETTLSTLYDAGYTIMALNIGTKMGSTELDASFELDANSYFTGLYAKKGDVKMATLAIVTDSKAVPASEAVIGTVKVNSELDHPMDKATFDGVTISELTAETTKEHVPDSTIRDDGSAAYLHGDKYSIQVDFENGVPISLEMKRKYDVDYTS